MKFTQDSPGGIQDNYGNLYTIKMSPKLVAGLRANNQLPVKYDIIETENT